MNNNEPDTLPDPAIGYIFQNDILALKQAFSLPDTDESPNDFGKNH
ncbi:hypothetical protein AZE01_02580 [Escherichia coli]|nr:hypothetical protein AZE01_02580 [Escherichia coli]PWS14793.1 hypothetical protein AZE03_01790 [Escherichia coli]